MMLAQTVTGRNPLTIGKIAVYKHSVCYSNVPTTKRKELFFSTASRCLVGTSISIGDVSAIIASQEILKKSVTIYKRKDVIFNMSRAWDKENI